jgi:hypothetical protein
MRSPFYFIVEPVGGKSYDNVRESGLIISTSKEDHKATNRFATVINTPIGYDGPIEAGDELVVHHNVFRSYYDMKGKERKSMAHLKDNLYIVDFDQFFLYRKPGGYWMAHSPYCFVEPIEKQKDLSVFEVGVEQPLIGKLVYVSDTMDMPAGTLVSYQPDAEYRFDIDGKKLYRMFEKNICIVL